LGNQNVGLLRMFSRHLGPTLRRGQRLQCDFEAAECWSWYSACNVVVQWFYPTPFDGWARGGTPWRPNSYANPNSGQKIKDRSSTVVPKMTCRRRSDAILFRRRWVISWRWCPQALQEEFYFRFILRW